MFPNLSSARARTLYAALALLGAPRATAEEEPFVPPGRYEITITQELPNVLRAGEARVETRCLSESAIADGSAFGVLSDNPISVCPISALRAAGDELRYRIVCPEPNSPHAQARFVRTAQGYEGAIALNMGGKNMTLIERQRARWLKGCSSE